MILTSVSPWLRNELKTPSKMDFHAFGWFSEASRSAFGAYGRRKSHKMSVFGDFRISIVNRGGILGGWARYIRWDSKTPGEIESARVDLVRFRSVWIVFRSSEQKKFSKGHEKIKKSVFSNVFELFAPRLLLNRHTNV